MSDRKVKKNIIIIFVLIIIISLYFYNRLNLNQFSIAVVVSESMEPMLSKNDLIIIEKKENYILNDIVVYEKDNDLIVHRIIKIDASEIITRGDNNPIEDNPISKNEIYGKVKFKIPRVGLIICFFKSNYVIIAIFLVIIFWFIFLCLKEGRKYQNEKKKT